MTCNEVKLLMPDIIREPNQYPDAEMHIASCDSCREEFTFIRSLQQELNNAYPAPSLFDTVPQRIRVMRKIRASNARRYFAYPIALAATIMLTLLLAPILKSDRPAGELYTYYETETLIAMMSIETPDVSQISDEELTAYLLENESFNDLNKLSF